MRFLPLDYPIRNLVRRPLQTGLVVLASALVAAILALTVAFVHGLESSFSGAGRDDVAIVMSSVAERDLVRSTASPAAGDTMAAEIRGIARVGGLALVSPEIHMGTNLYLPDAAGRIDTERPKAGFVRGVDERAFLVHDEVTLLEGRPPGSGEIIVGRLAAAKADAPAEAFTIGRKIRIEGGDFEVVGVFAAPGTTIESEIWVPLRELQGLSRRDDVSAFFVKLDDPRAFERLRVFCGRRLDLELMTISSKTYYRELTEYFAPIRWLALVLAVLIGGAAVASGANALGAAVQERYGELASLRAMGYPGSALVLALLVEALVIASAGGILGTTLAKLGAASATFRIGMSAFFLPVESREILLASAAVIILGLFGTLPPAIAILRQEIAVALKDR